MRQRHRLGSISDIAEGASKGFSIAGQALFAVKQRGQVYLYRNSCPHARLPLDWVPDQFLDHSGSLIQCASHGALFVIETGHCVKGPCAGQALEPIPWELEGDELFCLL